MFGVTKNHPKYRSWYGSVRNEVSLASMLSFGIIYGKLIKSYLKEKSFALPFLQKS